MGRIGQANWCQLFSEVVLLLLHRHTSGILCLYSNCALNVHAIAVMPPTTPSMIAVFVLQLSGWPYQPPAGDQTCLGYLLRDVSWVEDLGMQRLLLPEQTYGTLPPPPSNRNAGLMIVCCVFVLLSRTVFVFSMHALTTSKAASDANPKNVIAHLLVCKLRIFDRRSRDSIHHLARLSFSFYHSCIASH